MPDIMNEGAASAIEKSVRSVFVGNMPYEAKEEKLKDIFVEVGRVVSFKLVFDRETGKLKGAVPTLFLLNFEREKSVELFFSIELIGVMGKFK